MPDGQSASPGSRMPDLRPHRGLWVITGLALSLVGVLAGVVFYDTAVKRADPNFAAEYKNAKEAAHPSARPIAPGPAITAGTLGLAAADVDRMTITARRTISGQVCILSVNDGHVKLRVDSPGQFSGQTFYTASDPSFTPAPETASCKGNAFSSAVSTLGATPGLQTMTSLCLLLFAAALFIGWHFWAIPAAGTIARRASLWEKNKTKWSYNADTGSWNRKLYKDVTGDWMVSIKPMRREREVSEASIYRTSRFVVPIVALAWAILTFGTTYGFTFGYFFVGEFAFFIVLWQLLLLIPLMIDLVYMTGKQGWVGAMVIDPPVQFAPAGSFGPATIATPQEHPAQDDLGYKPSI